MTLTVRYILQRVETEREKRTDKVFNIMQNRVSFSRSSCGFSSLAVDMPKVCQFLRHFVILKQNLEHLQENYETHPGFEALHLQVQT